MVEQQPSKLNTRVRFPSPAPKSFLLKLDFEFGSVSVFKQGGYQVLIFPKIRIYARNL
jgi:hypothetical protein